mgnify:FL=1
MIEPGGVPEAIGAAALLVAAVWPDFLPFVAAFVRGWEVPKRPS